MLDRFKTAFARRVKDDSIESDTDDQQVALAAAMLLLEVAWADHEIEERELALIRNSLNSLYDISDSQVESVIDEAKLEHQEISSIFPFTRALNEQLNTDERRRLLESLWRLNTFDGSAFHYEESVIRKIAELLYLTHTDFITAKLTARDAEQTPASIPSSTRPPKPPPVANFDTVMRDLDKSREDQ
ncbi:MAG: TerB family tellurite resistance protein [Gammaproteobacteria bacterium]|nr:TerB family tellurite resistance protein [Gammaproteobacteria bacterium]